MCLNHMNKSFTFVYGQHGQLAQALSANIKRVLKCRHLIRQFRNGVWLVPT